MLVLLQALQFVFSLAGLKALAWLAAAQGKQRVLFRFAAAAQAELQELPVWLQRVAPRCQLVYREYEAPALLELPGQMLLVKGAAGRLLPRLLWYVNENSRELPLLNNVLKQTEEQCASNQRYSEGLRLINNGEGTEGGPQAVILEGKVKGATLQENIRKD